MQTIENGAAEGPKNTVVEPLLLDINQAAIVLNCSTKTIRRLLRRGKLTSCNVLRKVLIPRKQIEEFIKATCGKPDLN